MEVNDCDDDNDYDYDYNNPDGRLPRLRPGLDVMPSPLPDAPGLLLRDPLRYSEAIAVVPPPWAPLLALLDGEHTLGDARELMTRLAGGEIVPGDVIADFVSALDGGGFLDSESFLEMKRTREEAFRQEPVRRPTHAGSAYPEAASELESRFDGYFTPTDADGPGWPRAIVAPHVSPEGGVASYRAAYAFDGGTTAAGELPVFVILGTSHYGEPERMGLTRKPFETPLGRVEVATEVVDELVREGGDAFVEEDYCHLPEHSIEFQIVFLQHRIGRPFRVVPVLVGPFVHSLVESRPPETLDSNRRAFGALSALGAKRPALRWVLGVDMAHVGRRYGYRDAARANEGEMLAVAHRDKERIARIEQADADGFFELVHPNADPLSWCGYAPLYSFLRAVAPELGLRGELLHYEQWNIDPESVVSFAALHFR